MKKIMRYMFQTGVTIQIITNGYLLMQHIDPPYRDAPPLILFGLKISLLIMVAAVIGELVT